jgi:hypothetical protein
VENPKGGEVMEAKKPSQQPVVRSVEIVHTPHREDPTDTDFLAIIERRNEAMSRILEYAIRATHAGQWVDQQGKPWPTGAAAEVMARRCAVSIKNVQTNKVPSTDDKGGFYMYVITGTASLPGGHDSVEAIGTCSSRDQFLGTETRGGRQLSDIDEGNILKAAYTNFEVNAITRLLGVRNLSWERLEQLGISQSGVAKVEYNAGAKGGGTAPSRDGETVVTIGKDKGKKLSEVADLSWFRKTIQGDIAKPEKAKWREKNEKMLADIDAELARRANAKAGTVAKSAEPTPWERIQQLCKDAGIEKPASYTKGVTNKDHSSKMTEEDVAKVAGAISTLRGKQSDIPF